MSKAEDIRALEAMCPWEGADFRAGLAALGESTAVAARGFAADLRVLAALVGQVPRCAMDERGSSPWTSFCREVAVARRVSDQAAATEIRAAVRLTTVLPRTMDLLEAGRITVARANAFITELEVYDDELAGQLDTDLAERAAQVPRWRIAQDVRRAALRLDPETCSQREADATAQRGMSLQPQSDGQASVFLFGPAVPLTRWFSTLDTRARALRQAGDPRTLDNLRFDLATGVFPCATHTPTDPTGDTNTAAGAAATAGATAAEAAAGTDPAPAASSEHVPDLAPVVRPAGGVDPAPTDCRLSRPVQAMIVVPVETALGLSHDPAWLDGYGWISAPTCRQLLVDAELRRVCAQTGTGRLVDLADRTQRPPPTPHGLRQALLDMVHDRVELTDLPHRTEPAHDPSDLLRTFVTVRDRTCDGPTGSQTSARRAELDHDTPHPHGPTAAWNLVARGKRTHDLKHYGWTPLRTPTATIWTSPTGQLIEVPHHRNAPPGIDPTPMATPPTYPIRTSSPSSTSTRSRPAPTTTSHPGSPPTSSPPPPTGPGSTPSPTHPSRRHMPRTA